MNSLYVSIMFASCLVATLQNLLALEEPHNWRHDIVHGNNIPLSINQSYKSVGVLPFFIKDHHLFLILYRPEQGKYYSDLVKQRLSPNEQSMAVTAARLFFPYQQHVDARTHQVDWPNEKYLANMIFGGSFSRVNVFTMGNDHYTYLLNIHSPQSLKQTRAHPFIIVRFADFLTALNNAQQNGGFAPVSVTDSHGVIQPIYDKFIQGIGKPSNISYLRWIANI